MMVSGRVPSISRQTITRIPTSNGEFRLALYSDSVGQKEHMALILGEVAGHNEVLTRIHSECFTGDVLGSLRCDCGEQLDRAMRLISGRGRGVILYLRQEGRGIGLLDKLRAYNLQDEGYDTVDANLMLGHEVDARDYTVAAQMLADLGVGSIQLLTNNPLKMSALQELGVRVTRRVPIEVGAGPENLSYLRTKATRMDHLLRFSLNGNGHESNGNGHVSPEPPVIGIPRRFTKPAVTISYAQSLDGSIATSNGEQLVLSGRQSMMMTHRLRASHDAILIGIGTALADDPRLTVRLVEGRDPQPIVVDSNLRLSPNARLFTEGRGGPWIVTTDTADLNRQSMLEAAGATVLRVRATGQGQVDLEAMLQRLAERGVASLMVEGGSGIIRSFLSDRLVDQLIVTIAPRLIGGMRVLGDTGQATRPAFPRIDNVRYQWLGEDAILWGRPVWETP